MVFPSIDNGLYVSEFWWIKQTSIFFLHSYLKDLFFGLASGQARFAS